MDQAKEMLNQMNKTEGAVKQFLNDHDDFKYYGCGTIITAVKQSCLKACVIWTSRASSQIRVNRTRAQSWDVKCTESLILNI